MENEISFAALPSPHHPDLFCGECAFCLLAALLPDPDEPYIDQIVAKAKRVLQSNKALRVNDRTTTVIIMRTHDEMLCLLRPGKGVLTKTPFERDALAEALPECLHSLDVEAYDESGYEEPFFRAPSSTSPFDVKMFPFSLKGYAYRMWMITAVTVN